VGYILLHGRVSTKKVYFPYFHVSYIYVTFCIQFNLTKLKKSQLYGKMSKKKCLNAKKLLLFIYEDIYFFEFREKI
jgi:hypothetical protein